MPRKALTEESREEAIASSSPVRWYTGAELLAIRVSPPEYVIDGVIPPGCTLLSGREKTGKSFFVQNAAYALATGGVAFGQIPVGDRQRVMYLALEDYFGATVLRFQTLAASDERKIPPKLLVAEWEGWGHAQGDEAVQSLERELAAVPDTRLVIIDTLKKVRGRSRSRNAYDHDYESLDAFTQLCHRSGVPFLIVHHAKKSPADEFRDSYSGSSGTGGAVDSLAFLRVDPTIPNGLIYNVTGRYGPDIELAFKKDYQLSTVTLAGKVSEVKMNEERRIVRDTLKESAGTAFKPKELHGIVGDRGYKASESALRHLLAAMAKTPDSNVRGDGSRGYYYFSLGSE